MTACDEIIPGKNETASEDKSKILFGDNYPRLQQLKKKFDPDMFFSKWFAIIPAV